MCRPNECTQTEMVFHDTVPFDAEELESAIERAKKQKARILIIFQGMDCWLTPHAVRNIYIDTYGEEILITSVRRSITDLTKKDGTGRLIKGGREQRIKAETGATNNRWKFNNDYLPPLNINITTVKDFEK